jgi:hypothetical protein
MHSSLIVRLFALLTFVITAGCSSNNAVNLDTGSAVPEPSCPQFATTTIFAIGGLVGLPPCGGFGANLTYPPLSVGNDTTAQFSANVDTVNYGCTPTPTAVLWVVGFSPASNLTFVAAPTVEWVLPSNYVSNVFIYYYCIKDLTANIPPAPASQLGVLVNSTVIFPSTGPWGAFIGGHHYRIQFFIV